MQIMISQEYFQAGIRAGKEKLAHYGSMEAETSYRYSINSFAEYTAAFMAFDVWVVQPLLNHDFVSLDILHNAVARVKADFGETSGPAAIANVMMNHIIENVPAIPKASEIRELARILHAPMDPSVPIAAMPMQ